MRKLSSTWIIGASSGIGAALAREIASAGGDLFLSSRDLESLLTVKESLSMMPGDEAHCYPLDVADWSQVATAAEKIFKGDGIQRVVFMAALYDPMPLAELDVVSSERIIDVNLKGLLNVLNCVVPFLRRQADSQIAICSSLAGYRGLPNAQPYAATKAAATNIAESLRIEEAGLIDVKLINPGFVETRLTKKNTFRMPFLLTTEAAARYIMKGLSSRRFEIHFPRRFSMILKLLRILPYPVYFRIAKLFLPKGD